MNEYQKKQIRKIINIIKKDIENNNEDTTIWSDNSYNYLRKYGL